MRGQPDATFCVADGEPVVEAARAAQRVLVEDPDGDHRPERLLAAPGHELSLDARPAPA